MNYNDIDAVNISTLKVLWSQSPKHYRHRLEVQREETAALRLGIAAHMAVLEPLRFADHYTVRPADIDGRTKAGKLWLAEHAGRPILTAQEHAQCVAMSEAVGCDPVASLFMTAGKVEHPIQWTDEETGIDCKGRLDLLTDSGVLFGLKTARAVDPRSVAAQSARLGYHLQWAFYHDGLVALDQTPKRVVEVFVESSAPYDVVTYEIGDDVLDEGRQAYREALVALAACRATGEWPGQARAIVPLELPRWARTLDDEDGALDGLDFGGAEEDAA